MTRISLSNFLTDRAEAVKELAERVRHAQRTTAESAIEAGKLLIEAKEQCKHGEWASFLERAGIKERMARNYMTLARSGMKTATVADLGIRGALEHIAGKRAEAAQAEQLAELEACRTVLEAKKVELEAENAALKAKYKLFADMFPAWQRGGFPQVIADKDEVIRVQKTRLEAEIRDRDSYHRSAAYWKREARKLGYNEPERRTA